MDGCTAAAHVAYALSEVATIYPITPIASMGETADRWAIQGRKNLFGGRMAVKEMESELGAAGATHGALCGGALATTFTASQGLMLMIPNMYKIAGELLPAVFHVGTRSLATQALSIFGDHQDIMACRATGFAFLGSSSVQEAMDIALVAHLAAIEGRVPVVHFFDGWRTSNETATVDVIPYETMRPLVDWDAVAAFRRRAMNPEHPDLRGSAQNPDVYFQNREAQNRYYDAFPAIVKACMKKVGDATGRYYEIAQYFGAPDADRVIISMGSSAQVVAQTVEYLNANGYKVGGINLRLFRPFPAEDLIAALPESVKTIAVLDRTKEPGSNGEPLMQDVATAVLESGRQIRVIGGRYGLSSKEFDPVMVKAIFDEMGAEKPRRRFTVGIDDDLTGLSLDCSAEHFMPPQKGVTQAIMYGMGSDGTVGATRQLSNILTSVCGDYVQAYFNYSAKKSGGYTISQLRYGPEPIVSEYSILSADYVACNKDVYVRRFDMLDNLRDGGIFVLNTAWGDLQALEKQLPASVKRQIASKHLRFYTINAIGVAQTYGLGVRINTVMTTVFLHLMTSGDDFAKLTAAYKDLITKTYIHEGGVVVKKNLAAVETAVSSLKQVAYPDSWKDATEPTVTQPAAPEFIEKVARPCMDLRGNELPVSAFSPDGTLPMGTTAYEKRRIADLIPQWNVDRCVECTLCSLVCPHAAIRPYLLTAKEAQGAPKEMTMKPCHSAPQLKDYQYRIQVYVEDCVGCGSCAVICPGKALDMKPAASQIEPQLPLLDYCQNHVTVKDDILPTDTVVGTQLQQPLLEFSGACAGCGETPYVKLLTQLFGPRMIIANATGCSSIWGANFPSNAYCTDRNGHGPAWGNSLFEDNAEYGYGIACALASRRQRLVDDLTEMARDMTRPTEIRDAMTAWLKAASDPTASSATGRELIDLLKHQPDVADYQTVIDRADLLGKKTVWAIGGDGWAYDIGFAGLDHVLAQQVDINILVMDTECYSNTGGQTSKATPLGAVMKYAADGKRTFKKDLGRMMMTYGNVYVASIALGANYSQAIKALREAEEYPGPSIVIAYCPCINHGIRSGMSHSIVEEKLAVKAGYWPLYRFNPSLENSGKDTLSVDAPAPDGTLMTYLGGEDRYADLNMVDPREAAILHPKLQQRLAHIYTIFKTQSQTDIF